MTGLVSLLPAAGSTLELSGSNRTLTIAVLAIALIALVMGWVFRGQVLAHSAGTENMQSIGSAVEEGAKAYLSAVPHARHLCGARLRPPLPAAG